MKLNTIILTVFVPLLLCGGCKTNRLSSIIDDETKTAEYFERLDRADWSGFGGLSAELVKKDWVIDKRVENTMLDVKDLVYVSKNLRRGKVFPQADGTFCVILLSGDGHKVELSISDTTITDISSGRGASGFYFGKRETVWDSLIYVSE